jgi:arsenate reductase
MIIYHNPRCSKSRQSLALLRENGVEQEAIECLKTPLDELVLHDLLKKLGKKVNEIVRTKGEVYEKSELSADSTKRKSLRLKTCAKL